MNRERGAFWGGAKKLRFIVLFLGGFLLATRHLSLATGPEVAPARRHLSHLAMPARGRGVRKESDRRETDAEPRRKRRPAGLGGSVRFLKTESNRMFVVRDAGTPTGAGHLQEPSVGVCRRLSLARECSPKGLPAEAAILMLTGT